MPKTAKKTETAAFAAALNATATTKTKKTAKKSSAPTIVVSDEVKAAVDKVIEGKKKAKEAKALLNVNEPIVIDAVKEIQDKDGFAGKYRKSYDVPGLETDGVKFVSANKFSINGDDADEIADLVGDGYDELIEEDFQVSLKAEVFENKDLQAELMELLDGRFADFFDTKKVIKVKPDFDKNVFRHVDNEDDMAALRIFAKQYKPSLR